MILENDLLEPLKTDWTLTTESYEKDFGRTSLPQKYVLKTVVLYTVYWKMILKIVEKSFWLKAFSFSKFVTSLTTDRFTVFFSLQAS